MKTQDRMLFLFVLVLFAVALGCAKVTAPKQKFALPKVKQDCTLCHIPRQGAEGSLLKKPVSELCIGCHENRKAPNEHKVDIVPKTPVGGLPLTDGKMTCATCHDPHKNDYGSLLRMTERDLCFSCHKY